MGDLDDQIRDLLRPLMADVQSRKARLGRAFAKYPGPLDRIAYDGETGVFLDHLIGNLDDYGEVEPGLPALAVLLKSIRNDVGVGDQRIIDTILVGVREGARHVWAGPSVEEVLRYLDDLAGKAAHLPTYFPSHLRQAEAGRSPFDAIRQMVQVVTDRSAWDRWRAEERERTRAAGLEDNRLAYAPGRARPEERLDPKDDRDTRPAPPPPVPWDEHAAARFPRAVILGDPGFGKTWLLRYEARRLAHDGARVLRDRAGGLDALALPLWARLSDLNRTDDPLEEVLATGQSEAFRRFVHQRLEAGQAVVLLDAWDEVPVEVPEPGQPIGYKPNYRQRLGQRIDAFARRYPRCRVLLTSRIVGYDDSPIPDARELELFAFDGPQIEAFARVWFSDAATAESFLALLRQNLQVRGLARIPLMLTLMCRASIEQQHSSQPAKPSDALTRRVSIYSLCLRGLLRDWRVEEKKEPIREGDVEAILEVLAAAAYALFAGGGYEQFGEDVLREKVRASLQGLGAGHELAWRNPTDVIAILKHAGILITTGERRDAPLLFLHRTFHEYLAARALAQRAQAEGWEAIEVLLDRKAWRPAWQEVIVLLAGQLADPVPLLRLLADGRRDDLFRHRLALAALCLTEIPAAVPDPLSADGIATEVLTVWVKHAREGTGAVVAHLKRALSAIAQASPQGLGETRWGMRLLTLCLDTDPQVRRAAAEALGGLGPAAAPALDRLLELTRDADEDVRREAAEALRGLGPAAAPALDRLLELTRDADEDVRWLAARALGGLGAAAAPALDRLLELTRDEVRWVREAAAKALGGLGPAAAPALDRLLELTRDANPSVRWSAAEALGGLGPAAAPALDRLMDLTRDADDWGVRRSAAKALGGLGPAAAPALDRLLDLTRDADRSVRSAAAEALNRIMARGVWIFKVFGWKRFFLGNRVVRRLEELDPERPAAS